MKRLAGEFGNTRTENECHQYVFKQMSTRHFAMWHDHSTICGCGYILVTCKEIYNSTTYYTNEEYKALTGQTVDISAAVERPYVHMIVAGSS